MYMYVYMYVMYYRYTCTSRRGESMDPLPLTDGRIRERTCRISGRKKDLWNVHREGGGNGNRLSLYSMQK